MIVINCVSLSNMLLGAGSVTVLLDLTCSCFCALCFMLHFATIIECNLIAEQQCC